MDLALSFRTLWRRKWLILLAAIVAPVVGVLSAFDVSLDPFELRSRGVQYATVQSLMIVDQRGNQLSDATKSITPLNQRAGVVAGSLDADPIRRQVARDLGRRPSELRINTPLNAGGGGGAIDRSAALLTAEAPFGAEIDAGNDTPLIALTAQGPTLRETAAFAEGIARRGAAYTRTLPGNLRLRQISAPQGSVVNPGANLQVAIAVGVGTFIVLVLLLLYTARVVGDSRAARVRQAEASQ